MATAPDQVPNDVDALRAELLETRAKLSGAQALIEHQRLLIEKMKRAMFGPRSERSQRLLEQMELQLEETAAAAGEDEIKAQNAGIQVESFMRRKATRRSFPEQLPRRRIVHPAPTSCPCCGGSDLSKIGEDVTETLDTVPRQWFVTEHVREKFSCRSCETITQPPAPFHAIPRGFAGPSLLAMMLVEKYANHQPLNRQSEHYAREGIELSVSTMADHVGECAAVLMPLYELIKAHVFAAARIHGDDTTVPVLAKGHCRTGRIWTYVRDDRPFGGADPPAAPHRSPSRPFARWTPSSCWNARSMACHPSSAWPCAVGILHHWSMISLIGWNGSGASSRATTKWPRRWITCSSASRSSRASSTTAASA